MCVNNARNICVFVKHLALDMNWFRSAEERCLAVHDCRRVETISKMDISKTTANSRILKAPMESARHFLSFDVKHDVFLAATYLSTHIWIFRFSWITHERLVVATRTIDENVHQKITHPMVQVSYLRQLICGRGIQKSVINAVFCNRFLWITHERRGVRDPYGGSKLPRGLPHLSIPPATKTHCKCERSIQKTVFGSL